MEGDRLDAYRARRSAPATPEPFGSSAAHDDSPRPRLFVVQHHRARNLHWDLRLEMDGALESWAVPKGPSPDPADKRLAMRVEPHPLEYADFEGVIPEGQYGAGPSICWDRGTWIDIPGEQHGLDRGKLLFELRGYKLRGLWTLVHTPKSGENHWLLIKERDALVDEGGTAIFPADSILSGLTVDELADPGGRADTIRAQTLEAGAVAGAVDPAHLEVMKAVARDAAFDDPRWVFEIKYDGYRGIAERRGGAARLWSRNGIDFTATFPEIERAVRALPYEGLVLDGEIVVHDDTGMPSFSRLQRRGRLQRRSDVLRATVELPATYYAFDLLGFEGLDLRGLGLLDRKRLLREVLPTVGPLRYSDHIPEHGVAVFDRVTELGVEGVVGKRADAKYTAGRSDAWVKVRTVRTEDFVVVGWTPPRGRRAGFGALVLAAVEDGPEPRLVWAGNVGTGFDAGAIERLTAALHERAVGDSPLATAWTEGPEPHWVRPELVVEVRFSELTEAGMLRHPSFVAVREDKHPAECVVEGVGALPDPGPVEDDRDRDVVITNPDKLLFPPLISGSAGHSPPPSDHEGITKGEVVAWYEEVAPLMLPWLRDRCLVLTRYPDGIDGGSFYQKNAPEWAPEWIRRESVWSEGSERELSYFVVDDAPTLRYVANSAALLLHVWSSRVATLANPDWCILDLDPGEASFRKVIDLALHIRGIADDIGLPAYLKTSGSSGLHILLPLGRQLTFEQCRQLGQLLATVAVAERSDLATVERRPEHRGGRVYVDFLQNGWGKLLVAPFSTRPVPEASVSMPLAWDRLEGLSGPRHFTVRTALAHLERRATDPWAGLLDERPHLSAALARLAERTGL